MLYLGLSSGNKDSGLNNGHGDDQAMYRGRLGPAFCKAKGCLQGQGVMAHLAHPPLSNFLSTISSMINIYSGRNMQETRGWRKGATFSRGVRKTGKTETA